MRTIVLSLCLVACVAFHTRSEVEIESMKAAVETKRIELEQARLAAKALPPEPGPPNVSGGSVMIVGGQGGTTKGGGGVVLLTGGSGGQ